MLPTANTKQKIIKMIIATGGFRSSAVSAAGIATNNIAIPSTAITM
jgi:hypothetical protein